MTLTERSRPAEFIGAGVGALLGTLALAFTGPLALGGLLAGAVLGWAIGWVVGRLIAGLRHVLRLGRSRFRSR